MYLSKMGVKGLIQFQNSKKIYRSGEPVKAILKYSLDKPTKFTSIDICLVGKGKCWFAGGNAGSNRRFYRNKEEYVNASKHVLAGRVNPELLAGTYDCSFDFTLPEDIPTSFKNKSCTIEYKVTATFVKDNFFGTKNKFKAEVTVYGKVTPLSPEPLRFVLEKDLFSLSLYDKIVVKADIERTCVTPGENIKLNLNVINDSDVPITIKTELMKYLTYVSDDKSKQIFKESVKTTTAFTPTIERKSVTNFTCVVPTLPSLYSIQQTNVMIGEYKVRLTAKLPFPHINASVEAPVVIGERRDNLGPTMGTQRPPTTSLDNRSPSSSKMPAEDEKEETVEDFFEKYDIKWKDLQGKMSRQQH